MSLFAAQESENLRRAQPLAARMRPRFLDEFVGQQHLLGEGQLLRLLLQNDRLGTAIFYGPPGTGKTTLARLVAGETRRAFEQLSATLHGVKELRDVLRAARDRLAATGRGTLLFIDEIHRFNRAQQDALLNDVEEGIITLIGATTANPFFAVISALVSRGHVFQFQPLTSTEIGALLHRALADERGLKHIEVVVENEAIEFLASVTDGDARRALNTLEVAVHSQRTRPVRLTVDLVRNALAVKAQVYDPTGDEHYDTISALIKSIRGSDPDAAIYWLARMLEAGEDVRFLCRRLVILASEDVGNADPAALPLAVACFHACELVGLPECQLTLAQAVLYLACAPKSNAATLAIGAAQKDVRENSVLPVPRHLRDSHYRGARRLGHGEDYRYAHDAEGGVSAEDYLGVEREYYHPTDRGDEQGLAERLEAIRATLRQGKQQRRDAPQRAADEPDGAG